MKKTITKIGTIVPIIACFLLFSCKETEEEIFAPVLESNVDQLTFRAEGETKIVRVNSNRTFTISSAADWCKTEMVDGFDNLKVTVSPTDIIGKQRETTLTVSASDNEDVKLTVRQTGIEAVISASESSVLLADDATEFSLEIVTNLSALAFDLPGWIHEKAGNTTVIGKAIYHFTIDAGISGQVRKATIVVKAADPEINKQVSIPVEQGTSGINKNTKMTIEAENNLNGIAGRQEPYWAESGVMFGSNYFIDLPANGEASYLLNVLDEGAYNFTFDVASWGNAKPLEIMIGDIVCGSVSVPASDGVHISQVTITGVGLKVGEYPMKVKFNGNFDKFTVEYHGTIIPSISIEAEDNLDGIPGIQQPYWVQSGDMFGSNFFIDISNRSVSYSVQVQETAVYNFTFDVASWNSAKDIELFVDDVSVGRVTVEQSGGVIPTKAIIGNIAMGSGTRIVKVAFAPAFSFDKFVISYNRK